jgi:hypothetical protein
VAISLAVYARELAYGVQLHYHPHDAGAVSALAYLLFGIFAVGFLRSWQLLGASRAGLLAWLSPLQDAESSRADTESADFQK